MHKAKPRNIALDVFWGIETIIMPLPRNPQKKSFCLKPHSFKQNLLSLISTLRKCIKFSYASTSQLFCESTYGINLHPRKKSAEYNTLKSYVFIYWHKIFLNDSVGKWTLIYGKMSGAVNNLRLHWADTTSTCLAHYTERSVEAHQQPQGIYSGSSFFRDKTSSYFHGSIQKIDLTK